MPGADLDVSLYTFGPGQEVWERFGHNAIEIRNRDTGDAILYNYGVFDFAQKNFFLNFARGRMTYRIAAARTADELPLYEAEGRWIVEQRLDLTPAQRHELADFLAWNARPENAQYRYDYFRANCSTRVRDALDAAVGGAIKAQTIGPSRGFTYRMDADRLMRPDPLLMLAMDAGLGPYADQRLSYWDESFVPMQFMKHMRDVTVTGASGSTRPLVASERLVSAARLPEPPALPPNWLWQALGIGVVGAFAVVGLARLHGRAWARVLVAGAASVAALTLGCGGLILVALWTLTDHVAAWGNENIMLFDPLCLLLLPCWIGAFRRRWRPTRFAVRMAFVVALLASLSLLVKAFPAFLQDNLLWIALLLPLHTAFAFVIAVRRARASEA